MKRYNVQIAVTLLFSLLLIAKVSAQQVPQFTQLLQNRYMLNPAASGLSEDNNVLAGFRKQWVGMDQGPTTYYLGYNRGFVKTIEPKRQPLAIRTARVEDYHSEQKEGGTSRFKHGFGGYIVGDNYGAFKNMSLNISYALHAALNDNITFAFGASSRFHNSKFDASLAQVENAGDATYDAFIAERNGLTSLEFDLGTYLYGKNWFAGYSTNQLTRDKITFGDISNNILKTHHTIIGGYTLKVTENIDVTPSTIIKTVAGAPLSVDVLANAEFNNMISLGLGYRTEDAIMIMAGIKLDSKYRLGYSYDINTSRLSNYNSGSHEITIGVNF